jgi:heptosyltransferase-2
MMRFGEAKHRIGYLRDLRGCLLTDGVARPTQPDGTFRPTYMVDYYLGLCEHLGLQPGDRRTELSYSSTDRRKVRAILRRKDVDPDAPLFLVHATAGYGPSKLWPARYFARLADLLSQQFGAQICGIGDPAARETIQRIHNIARRRVHDLTTCGIDLHLLKALVALSDLMVTTDSGPRHYGVALNVPTVCVMGPTSPDYSTSNRPNDHIVRVEVPCGPCQKKFCATDHRCMEEISPEMVLDTCRRALEEAKA